MFAKAEQLAVVDGSQLKTPEQIEYEAKAQEIAAIYGNDTNNADPYAGLNLNSSSLLQQVNLPTRH